MPPEFGTSGLRGLVSDLTPDLVDDYVRAFIASGATGGTVHVGQDLRPSSCDIARGVVMAIRDAGLVALDHGALPTPALALASMAAGQAAIMITGSHIPADRNGLKFYRPDGEISKEDESAILNARDILGAAHLTVAKGPLETATTALPVYVSRYVDAFGSSALAGLRIGVYQHSSVARDVMTDILAGLGAETIALARSDVFIPVDTEAVDPATRAQLAGWAKTHALDAIVSTDGDADRPMVAGNDGTLVPGDVLGPLTAGFLGARTLVTPVSSNSMIERMAQFTSRHRTRIGSPFVIADMEDILASDPAAKVAGYEPNGGFLLGFTAKGPAGDLAPLMTRDCMLPMIAPLVAAKTNGLSLAQMVATLPACFTASDRVQNIPRKRSVAFIDKLTVDESARAVFFEDCDAEVSIDLTDGLRVTFEGGVTVHLRPSGNAPECRCYVQAPTRQSADGLIALYISKLARRLCL